MFGAGVFGAGIFGAGVVSTAYITVGSHEFIVEGGLGDLEAPVLVLDGLSLGWKATESDPWPTQPAPVGAGLGLWTHDVDNLDDVALGDRLAIVLVDSTGLVFATFHGRVASMTARAGDGPGGLAMWYTISGVDYTVDLAELPIHVGTVDLEGQPVDWPAEPALARLERIAATIALEGATIELPAADWPGAFAPLAAGDTNALELLTSHLAQLAVMNDHLERYALVPVVADSDLAAFQVVPLASSVDASLLPATLVLDGTTLVLDFPDLDANGVVRAGDVELDTTWTRTKFRAVNDVTTTGPVTGHAVGPAGPRVRLALSHNLTDQAAADAMAALYLPNADEPKGWVAEGYTLLADRHPATLDPPWFPDHRDDPADTTVYAMPVAIVGTAPAINLHGDVDAGQLVHVNLVLADGKPRVEFSLRHALPYSHGPDAATWEWIQDTYPGVTIADVDPDLTIYDVRLARRF